MTLFRTKRNPHTHATIDLETLGTSGNSCVFEVGVAAATFSPDHFRLTNFKSRCYTFDLVEAMRCGSVDPRTIAWWISDASIPQGVRDRLRKIWNREGNQRPHTIPEALMDLNRFLAETGALSIWANGAAFDFVLTRDLFTNARRVYEQNSKFAPGWGYRDEMCLRPLRRAYSTLWKDAEQEADLLMHDVLGPDSGKHAADFDCLVNLTFLGQVNRRMPLVSEEIIRATEDKSRQ